MAQHTSRQALDILARALDVSPDERDVFVHSECGADATLLDEVRSLLASSDSAPADFLSPPPSPPVDGDRLPANVPVDALIGRTIGKYEITNVIGSGGMGTVYAARQVRPQKTVALKVLRPGLLNRSVAKRFDHEAEVLARLRHPNIAQVFEAGLHNDTATGQALSYFAMELVPEAKPITTFAGEAGLDIKTKLALFLDVCDGVQHGHQRGVIHRDLKPGNILVDDEGRVKIIDFGVARSTDADIALTTMHTEVGQLIGTLQYMSPEQCAADPLEIDTRCDVYALGAVLYELLTGRVPYDVSNMTLHAASRVICEQPAERPSRFAASVSDDLDAILLKALAKRREDRYASASEFARDLRAFLNGEPIQARPPTLWQRATIWAMRHPKAAPVLSSLVIVAGIVGGSAAVVSKRMHDLGVEPDRMLFNEKYHDKAILISRSNKTIARWNAPSAGAINFAILADTPEGEPGTAYAIVGGRSLDELGKPNGVNVYRVTDGKAEIHWTDNVQVDDLPDTLKAEGQLDRVAVERSFCADRCWLNDVFPSRPGKELVVVFANAWASRMLVIYDIDTRERLYRVWHSGCIDSTSCLPKHGLLLLIAEDARSHLSKMGYDEEEIRPPDTNGYVTHPMMMIALKPQIGDGVLEPTFIALTEDMDGVRPEWTRWWTPLWARGAVKLRFNPAMAVPDPDTQVDVSVDYRGSEANFGFAVDQNGEEVAHTRRRGDAYTLFLDDAPEHRVFRLCDRLPQPGEKVPPGECPP